MKRFFLAISDAPDQTAKQSDPDLHCLQSVSTLFPVKHHSNNKWTSPKFKADDAMLSEKFRSSEVKSLHVKYLSSSAFI